MGLSNTEKAILDSIIVASENDPTKPEFPPDHPKFPATPTYHIHIPPFLNVWLKDESKNPTGTHKDRMAWEIIVTYRDFLRAKERRQIQGSLPAMSIISSGSAAIAIQTQLRKYALPDLHVLMDNLTDQVTIDVLRQLGCKLFFTDLTKKSLHWREILDLTQNPHGFDITSSEALDPTTRFYDWLSYEIINASPDYCFIPFGTGHLFQNILNITKKEVSTDHHDPRFQGDVETLRRCHFFGATTNNPNSKIATKLYSPHSPFLHYDEQWIQLYRYAGFCGSQSTVSIVEEQYVDEAIRIAIDQNIDSEPSGIAGLALFLQMKESISHHVKILIVNTGKAKYAL